MQRFYKDFESLDLFTRSLAIHQSKTQCAHCFKHTQFVSHGIVYKQRSMAEREPVGKRLFCSNRNGRSGCGRTVQLRIAERIPHLRYSATAVSMFIALLLAQVCIGRAYQQATGQFETRHAWRWVTKLLNQLSTYRCALRTRAKTNTLPLINRARRLSLILPTLARMNTALSNTLCADYQQRHQHAFM
jgi:hypothetical protein